MLKHFFAVSNFALHNVSKNRWTTLIERKRKILLYIGSTLDHVQNRNYAHLNVFSDKSKVPNDVILFLKLVLGGPNVLRDSLVGAVAALPARDAMHVRGGAPGRAAHARHAMRHAAQSLQR